MWGIDLADSRLLDDVEELILPGVIAIGGLYALWWVTQSVTSAVESIPGAVSSVVDYDLPIVGEGDLIDRWTLNPGEALRLVDRTLSGVGRAGANILRWRPW